MKSIRKLSVLMLALVILLSAAVPAAAAIPGRVIIHKTCGDVPSDSCGVTELLSQCRGCSPCVDLCALLRQIGVDCSRNTCRGASCALPSEPPAEIPTTPVPSEQPTEAPKPIPTEAPTQPPTQKPQAPSESSALSAYEQEVVALTNEYRAQYGLAPLTADVRLSEIARQKSQDMHDKRYFDHHSPTYGTPFEMMNSFGVTYRTAGENIAMGYRTAKSVVEGWMNSPGHRANILNSRFTRIGVGYVADGSYCTQMFIG